MNVIFDVWCMVSVIIMTVILQDSEYRMLA